MAKHRAEHKNTDDNIKWPEGDLYLEGLSARDQAFRWAVLTGGTTDSDEALKYAEWFKNKWIEFLTKDFLTFDESHRIMLRQYRMEEQK